MMRSKNLWVWVGLLIVLVALAGCGSADEGAGGQAESMPESVSCEVYYRPRGGAALEGSTLSLSTDGDQASLDFDDMAFEAVFITDVGEGRSLSILVGDLTAGAEIARGLYQFDPEEGPRDQFIGGHGFTGLAYVFHPDSGAEMQYFCGVGE